MQMAEEGMQMVGTGMQMETRSGLQMEWWEM